MGYIISYLIFWWIYSNLLGLWYTIKHFRCFLMLPCQTFGHNNLWWYLYCSEMNLCNSLTLYCGLVNLNFFNIYVDCLHCFDKYKIYAVVSTNKVDNYSVHLGYIDRQTMKFKYNFSHFWTLNYLYCFPPSVKCTIKLPVFYITSGSINLDKGEILSRV